MGIPDGDASERRLLGGTIVVIGVGVVCNVLQDLPYGLLDPMVDTDTR